MRTPVLTTATADTTTGQAVRVLLAQLADIAADRAMCARLIHPGTWPVDLAREQRDCWRQLTALLTKQH